MDCISRCSFFVKKVCNFMYPSIPIYIVYGSIPINIITLF